MVSAALALLHRRDVIPHRHCQNSYDHFLADVEDRFALVDVTLQDHSQALVAHHLTLIFVSGDNTLFTAAQAEGLPTDNPFDHLLNT